LNPNSILPMLDLIVIRALIHPFSFAKGHVPGFSLLRLVSLIGSGLGWDPYIDISPGSIAHPKSETGIGSSYIGS
jgi:hypothetical protein